jgi:hypothetical protein
LCCLAQLCCIVVVAAAVAGWCDACVNAVTDKTVRDAWCLPA